MNTDRPLSPECLIENCKYRFKVNGFVYVGYFYRLEFISTKKYLKAVMACVFTTKKYGGGKFVCAFKPYQMNEFRLATRYEKCDIYKED